jgi:hypothetical protein
MLDQPITLPVIVGGAMVMVAVYVGAISGAGRADGEDSAAATVGTAVGVASMEAGEGESNHPTEGRGSA